MVKSEHVQCFVGWSCCQYLNQGRRQGWGAEGAATPTTKKREEREGRGKEEEKKKEKRGIKRERKLNQSFQEHVFMGFW